MGFPRRQYDEVIASLQKDFGLNKEDGGKLLFPLMLFQAVSGNMPSKDEFEKIKREFFEQELSTRGKAITKEVFEYLVGKNLANQHCMGLTENNFIRIGSQLEKTHSAVEKQIAIMEKAKTIKQTGVSKVQREFEK